MKKVEELLRETLRAQGYDGLLSDDFECSCRIDDLAACDGCCLDCIPSHETKDGIYGRRMSPGPKKEQGK
jgi:hypothetical protein